MIKNFDDLCKATYEQIKDRTPAQVQAAKDARDPALRVLLMLWRTYNRAQESALSFGYIGVGCIYFAEARMVQAQHRLAALRQA